MNIINASAKTKIIGLPIRRFGSSSRKKRIDAIPRHFSEFFIPILADSSEILREAFKIRHSVYCEELGFEEIRENGLETDGFDENSLHILIQNMATKHYAGTVRIVRSSNSKQLLPIEKYCLHSLYSDGINPSSFPRESICEISRLAVSSEFRKRSTDQFDGAADGGINRDTYSEKEMRCFPFITVGLYLGIVAVCQQQEIEHFFVMMEPKLARSMAFIGIKLEQIGDVIEYHGKRAPYYINYSMFYESVSPSLMIMLKNLKKELDRQSQHDQGCAIDKFFHDSQPIFRHAN